MSRYDRYSEEALGVMRRTQDNVRSAGRELLVGTDLIRALLEVNPPAVREFLALNQATPAALPPPTLGGDPSAKVRLGDDARGVLDLAEQLAGEASVQDFHLLQAAWERLAPEVAGMLTKSGRAVTVEELALPTAKPAARPARPTDDLPKIRKLAREMTGATRRFPVVGRDQQINDLMGILLKCFKPNALLVGEPGVGKTALVEGLAQRIDDGRVPEQLAKCRIFDLRVSDLVAGTGQVGSLEERMQGLLEELEQNPDLILFLDEVHQLVGDFHRGLADILKPALARGRFRCIGATTQGDYHRLQRVDSALCRRFHNLFVAEPDRPTTAHILAELRPSLEQHYRLKIPDVVLADAITLSAEFLVQRRFPDKAIDVVDQACAAAVRDGQKAIDTRTLRRTVGHLVGITSLDDADKYRQRLEALESVLNRQVLGQEPAVQAVANTVRLCKHRLDLRPERPDGVFLFLGPTGVGKTALAAALADGLTGSQDALTQIDLSEYSEPISLTRLIGSPAGYVGSDEEPELIAALRAKPCGILLLDEFEKAHRSIHHLFLQAFDAGRLTDAHGITYSLANITIIATANIWEAPTAHPRLGFRADDEAAPAAPSATAIPWGLLSAHFSQELLNRFDEIIVFNPLTPAVAEQILLSCVVETANQRLRETNNLELVLTPAAVQAVLTKGFSERFGVRFLQRSFEAMVMHPLVHELPRLPTTAGPAHAKVRADWDAGHDGPTFQWS